MLCLELGFANGCFVGYALVIDGKLKGVGRRLLLKN